MSKRGQVTVFIILGIVVIAVIAFFLYLGGIFTKEEMTREEAERFVATQIEPIRNFVEGCVEDSAWVVLNTMGHYGGYVVPRYAQGDPHFELLMPTSDILTTNYAAYETESGFINTFPSSNEMRNEFELYLEGVALDPDAPLRFSDCINDFDYFENYFDDVEYGELDTNVEFGEKIIITVDFPVTLKKSSYETTVNDYYVELPINMKEIRRVSSGLINELIEGNGPTGLVEFREDLVAKYTSELLAGTREDSIGVDWMDSFSFDLDYNSVHNYFFSLKYENPELDNVYVFNFLVGLNE